MAERRDGPSPEELAGAAALLRVVTSRLLRQLRAVQPGFEVTPAQAAVLSRLTAGGVQSTADLARAEQVRPQSMRVIIAALEGQGLVSRRPHPTDGRQSLVALTPEGEQLVRSNRGAREDWLVRAMTERLSAAEQRKLVDSIGLLARLAD